MDILYEIENILNTLKDNTREQQRLEGITNIDRLASLLMNILTWKDTPESLQSKGIDVPGVRGI